MILNIITLASNFSSVNYYIKSIKKVWVKYPILDLSLTKKKGYEKIIFFNYEKFQQKCDCSLTDDFQRFMKGNVININCLKDVLNLPQTMQH